MYFKRIIPTEKNSKRSPTLLVSKNEFNRFTDFKTETEKLSDISEEKSRKLVQMKKLSYEITKDWEDAIGTIQKRRREELLKRRKKIDDTKVKLIEETTKKNALEYTEIVKEAQKLILYRKPQFRLINRALFASECYRELNAQLDFKKKLKILERDENKQYVDELKEQTENHLNKERKKFDERMNEMRMYSMELKKQIENSNSQLRIMKLQELNADKEDLNNMIKGLQLIDKCEADQVERRKKEARNNYLDAMKEKAQVDEKKKYDDEIQNQLIAAYAKTKDHLNKITKDQWKQSLADQLRRSELMAEKCAVIWKSNEDETEECLKKAQEIYKKMALERVKSKRIMKDKMHADMHKYHIELAIIKKDHQEEEKKLIVWERLQRYKRDEYNKEMKLKELERVRKDKMEMANDLLKQMAEQKEARKQELIMNDDSAAAKAALERTNEKVIAYSQDILQESSGVRPLFPIIKAIETFKNSNGLIPSKEYAEDH